ncbi:MAG: FAD-binding protein [Alphaproteobacteria bacterium]|nr:FAD-binding protein [Alphaproteobacteria bacterium]
MPRWSNWARTVTTEYGEVARPEDEGELAALVAAAATEGRRLRVPGSGHSWSGCAAPEDVWVQLDGLPRGMELDGDTVLVTGTVTLGELVGWLWAHDRMLPNLGTITAQTVVGATATGTHGTGLSLPVISAGVTGMRLVDGRGEVRLVGAEDPAIAEARVHLGALGLVTALRLTTVPATRLSERLVNLPLDAALEQLDEALATHRHLRLWWLPQAGVVQLYTADPTDDADTGPNDLAVRLDRWGVQQPVFAGLLALAGLVPSLVPTIHRFAQATSFPPRHRVESQPHVLTMPVPPRHDEVEISLPASDRHDAIRELWRLSHAQPHCPDFVQEVRFVAADDIALSPAQGRDSVYLGAYCTNPGTAAAYHRDMLAYARAHGGRPHWGKRFDHTAPELWKLYEYWGDFQALRRQWDPRGVFQSAWHDRVLGPLS